MDITGRKAGRGAYICHDAACLAKARKRKSMERAFSTSIPDEVYERLADEIQQEEEDGG